MIPCGFLYFAVVKITFHAYIIHLTSLPFSFQLKLGWGVFSEDLERRESIAKVDLKIIFHVYNIHLTSLSFSFQLWLGWGVISDF